MCVDEGTFDSFGVSRGAHWDLPVEDGGEARVGLVADGLERDQVEAGQVREAPLEELFEGRREQDRVEPFIELQEL